MSDQVTGLNLLALPGQVPYIDSPPAPTSDAWALSWTETVGVALPAPTTLPPLGEDVAYYRPRRKPRPQPPPPVEPALVKPRLRSRHVSGAVHGQRQQSVGLARAVVQLRARLLTALARSRGAASPRVIGCAQLTRKAAVLQISARSVTLARGAAKALLPVIAVGAGRAVVVGRGSVVPHAVVPKGDGRVDWSGWIEAEDAQLLELLEWDEVT